MVAQVEADLPSHTEQLSDWITRVRCKRLICRRNRKRDLRVEAVLACALTTAEMELRDKQLARIARWQQLKKHLLKNLDTPMETCHQQHLSAQAQQNQWQQEMSRMPELRSLDNFMSKLSEIKIPLQR